PPTRAWPTRLEEPWYDADHQVRRVKTDGTIPWLGERVFVGHALARERVGLKPHETGGYLVRFMTRDLGLLDVRGRFHPFAPPRWKLRAGVEPATTDSR
ncbi:MAG: hypothetical protein EA356_03340, partial [Geminicoccaceae bacterium]